MPRYLVQSVTRSSVQRREQLCATPPAPVIACRASEQVLHHPGGGGGGLSPGVHPVAAGSKADRGYLPGQKDNYRAAAAVQKASCMCAVRYVCPAVLLLSHQLRACTVAHSV
jgi:hypothetical protein